MPKPCGHSCAEHVETCNSCRLVARRDGRYDRLYCPEPADPEKAARQAAQRQKMDAKRAARGVNKPRAAKGRR